METEWRRNWKSACTPRVLDQSWAKLVSGSCLVHSPEHQTFKKINQNTRDKTDLAVWMLKEHIYSCVFFWYNPHYFMKPNYLSLTFDLADMRTYFHSLGPAGGRNNRSHSSLLSMFLYPFRLTISRKLIHIGLGSWQSLPSPFAISTKYNARDQKQFV